MTELTHHTCRCMHCGDTLTDQPAYMVFECKACKHTPCICQITAIEIGGIINTNIKPGYDRIYVQEAPLDVNRPAHYNTGKIEVIDFIEDQKLDFHSANALKYICRAKHKGTEVKDLQKAIWYLTRQLKTLESK